MRSLFLAAVVSLAALGTAQATQVTIGTDEGLVSPGRDNQGWWNLSTINGNPTNDNYYTGNDYRSYFTFDLSGVAPGTISGLMLEVRRYTQSGPIDLGFWDVSTSATDLAQRGIVNAAIHADLGSGTSYGNSIVATGASTDVISFVLNGDAVAGANAAAGGYFSVGAAVNGAGTIFVGSSAEPGNGGVGYTQQLVVTTAVPLPAGVLLMLGGLGALAAQRRRTS